MYYACILKYNLLSLYNFTFNSPFRVLSWSNCRNWFSEKDPLPIARVLRWGITREQKSMTATLKIKLSKFFCLSKFNLRNRILMWDAILYAVNMFFTIS